MNYSAYILYGTKIPMDSHVYDFLDKDTTDSFGVVYDSVSGKYAYAGFILGRENYGKWENSKNECCVVEHHYTPQGVVDRIKNELNIKVNPQDIKLMVILRYE